MIDEHEARAEGPATKVLLERTLASAYQGPDGDSAELWKYISQLHGRRELEIFEAAAAWCASEESLERALGADVLGQLGHVGDEQVSPFGKRSLPILLGLLGDPSASVVQSAITALGHLATWGVEWDVVAIEGLATRAVASVRQAVAFALGGGQCDRSETAVAVMLRLCEDQDADVRNWATFGLGVQSEADSPAIRAALHARRLDPDEEVRGEALVALAKRGEQGVLAEILAELSASDVSNLAIEAALELGGAECLPHLERLLAAHPDSTEILEAIASCRGQGA